MQHKESERKRREDYIFEHTDDPDVEGAERAALRRQEREEKNLDSLLQQRKDAKQNKKQVEIELESAKQAAKLAATEWFIAQENHDKIDSECEGARCRWRREKNPRMKLE